ncbi:MAG: RidA family protein [Asticcacaulis sp.]|uniref:RidA family protein n=1 Tax=Asticcacaulis sp. TaxID=1872648 RepID=UPI003F7B45E4
MKALILMAVLFLPVVARAETPPVNRVYAGSFPIAESVAVPPGYTTLYVSGLVPSVTHPDAEKGTLAAYGDTEEQTESVIQNIRKALQAQGADLKDIVSMRVYLAADPTTGKMDFAGMMKAYTRYFGTSEQPNKPARAAFQVAALTSPAFLVEIEVVAVKPAA